jgi:hypothetical protein
MDQRVTDEEGDREREEQHSHHHGGPSVSDGSLLTSGRNGRWCFHGLIPSCDVPWVSGSECWVVAGGWPAVMVGMAMGLRGNREDDG